MHAIYTVCMYILRRYLCTVCRVLWGISLHTPLRGWYEDTLMYTTWEAPVRPPVPGRVVLCIGGVVEYYNIAFVASHRCIRCMQLCISTH